MDYRNSEGKIVGTLTGQKYRSHRRSSKHLLRTLDAWGIDVSIVNRLKKEGCEEIRILDHDDMTIYVSNIDTFVEKGVEKNFVGRQLFLPREHWIKIEAS